MLITCSLHVKPEVALGVRRSLNPRMCHKDETKSPHFLNLTHFWAHTLRLGLPHTKQRTTKEIEKTKKGGATSARYFNHEENELIMTLLL